MHPRTSRIARRWSAVPRWVRWVFLTLILGAVVLYLVRRPDRPNAAVTYVPRDQALVQAGLTFYVPPSGYLAPRAVLIFFGNDVGFWRPHRLLAGALARDGYAVVGVDIRPLLAGLPDDPAPRARAARVRVASLVARVYAELARRPRDRTARVPLVLLGHSLGAELALWVAATLREPPLDEVLRGVVALSPGSRSHLRISVSDLLMSGEPHGPGSFAVADMIGQALSRESALRIAIVRGDRDPLGSADAALLAAGGPQVRRFRVPFAGHSLSRLLWVGSPVRRGLDWVLAAPVRPSTAAAMSRRPPAHGVLRRGAA